MEPLSRSIQNLAKSYKPPADGKLVARKILNFISFGKIAVNPRLDKIIREIVKISDKITNEDLKALNDLLAQEGLSQKSKFRLQQKAIHETGTQQTTELSHEDLLKKIQEKTASKNYFVINNPNDPVDFALGTFSTRFPVTIDDIPYRCAEAAFQASKFTDEKTKREFSTLTGFAAQQLANEYKKKVSPDWESQAYGLMEGILNQRFKENENLKNLLLATGNSYLVAHSPNSFWGDGHGAGENKLGKICMNLRKYYEGVGAVRPPANYLIDLKIPTEFKVCTYNLGSGIVDYRQLMPETWTDQQAFTEAEENLSKVKMKLLEEIVTDLIPKNDVFCLQEVQTSNTPILKKFEENGFQVLRPSQKGKAPSDTALAINKKRFTDIELHPFPRKAWDVIAIATAIDITTKKKVAFISGHIAGFNLEADTNAKKVGAESGDKALKKALKSIDKVCKGCDLVVMGADFNASLDTYKDRFDILEKGGFRIYSPDAPTTMTTYPGWVSKLFQRKLDHIAIRSSQPIVVKSHPVASPDPMSRASDHAAVEMTIAYETHQISKKRFKLF